MDLKKLAEDNLLNLRENPCPGIVVGIDESGKYIVQAYWIMGKNPKNRNYIFIDDDGAILKIAPADPTKTKDPNLLVYTAMDESGSKYAVSNGSQTSDALSLGGLQFALRDWKYKPDAPNFTPRITAVVDRKLVSGFVAQISILKKSLLSDVCEGSVWVIELLPGFGHCITTCSGKGNPSPVFDGAPYKLPLSGNIEDIASTFWNTLNKENKISLAVKFIPIEAGGKSFIKVINKYEAVV